MKKRILALIIELAGCAAICVAVNNLINPASALLTGGIMAIIIGAALENDN